MLQAAGGVGHHAGAAVGIEQQVARCADFTRAKLAARVSTVPETNAGAWGRPARPAAALSRARTASG